MNPDYTRQGADPLHRNIELHATEQDTVLCDLNQFGMLRVSGADAEFFLQNMLSNDIRELGTGHAQLSSLNTPKGRMLASMLIWLSPEGYLLQLPRTLCEPMRKKLSMYVLRAKVKIANISDERVTLGLSGLYAAQILKRRFGALPEAPLGYTDFGQAGVLKYSDTRFQVCALVADAQALRESFSQHAQTVGSVCWDWLNIRAGIPIILPQTQEQFVPQMVNFDLLGGVNFKKGCYPGQEIVARMQYLGKLKRRMYLFHIRGADLENPPQAGDELYGADLESCGQIVNISPAPDGGYDGLAVIQIASRETQTVHYLSAQGEALQFLQMPYPLEAG
jgi:tRNA-modifying protein YgfZ